MRDVGRREGAIALNKCFSFHIPSFVNCCWMEWSTTVNFCLKLRANCFSFFFKAFGHLSLQTIGQDLCSSIFIPALALGILEALGIYGQSFLTGNWRAVLQPFQLPFSFPQMRTGNPVCSVIGSRGKGSVLAHTSSWQSFEVNLLPQQFLSWWTGFSMSAASHQQIFNQLCIGTVPCEVFKKTFLIHWFSFLPEELTSVQDEYYCALLI